MGVDSDNTGILAISMGVDFDIYLAPSLLAPPHHLPPQPHLVGSGAPLHPLYPFGGLLKGHS